MADGGCALQELFRSEWDTRSVASLSRNSTPRSSLRSETGCRRILPSRDVSGNTTPEVQRERVGRWVRDSNAPPVPPRLPARSASMTSSPQRRYTRRSSDAFTIDESRGSSPFEAPMLPPPPHQHTPSTFTRHTPTLTPPSHHHLAHAPRSRSSVGSSCEHIYETLRSDYSTSQCSLNTIDERADVISRRSLAPQQRKYGASPTVSDGARRRLSLNPGNSTGSSDLDCKQTPSNQHQSVGTSSPTTNQHSLSTPPRRRLSTNWPQYPQHVTSSHADQMDTTSETITTPHDFSFTSCDTTATAPPVTSPFSRSMNAYLSFRDQRRRPIVAASTPDDEHQFFSSSPTSPLAPLQKRMRHRLHSLHEAGNTNDTSAAAFRRNFGKFFFNFQGLLTYTMRYKNVGSNRHDCVIKLMY